MVSGDQPSWNPPVEYERFPFGIVENNPIDSLPSESIDTMDREIERTQQQWDYETDYQDKVEIIPSSSTSLDDLITSSTTERDETTTIIIEGISISTVNIYDYSSTIILCKNTAQRITMTASLDYLLDIKT